ncbi:hypothetical protein ACTSKR_13865 [Chitinibacteraceae bacterium HSL-7]
MATHLMASTRGEAFDLKKQSSRPEFHFSLSCCRNASGDYELQRSWHGLGPERLCLETARWRHSGLVHASTAQTHLHESASVDCRGDECLMQLSSQKKNVVQHKKTVRTPYPGVTLLSVVADIAANWHTLQQGQPLLRSYLVLKVQAHTGVRLHAQQRNDRVYVAMTPVNWFWQAMFGATEFVFCTDQPILLAINGLIEPRDLSRAGRYIEYLARCPMPEPLDLSALQTRPAPALGHSPSMQPATRPARG